MAACSTTQKDSAVVIDLTNPTDTVCFPYEFLCKNYGSRSKESEYWR